MQVVLRPKDRVSQESSHTRAQQIRGRIYLSRVKPISGRQACRAKDHRYHNREQARGSFRPWEPHTPLQYDNKSQVAEDTQHEEYLRDEFSVYARLLLEVDVVD